MLTLAQWIARFTRGYIKFTGKKPDKLAKLKIKFEAAQKVKDQQKVVDLRGDVLDPNKPIIGGTQSGTTLSKEFQSGIMRATGSKPTELKLDKLRKDVLKEIENRKKEDYLPDIIDPEDYGFSVSDGTWTDEVEELMEMLVKEPKAYGGIAGMLGERTGYKDAKLVEGADYFPPKNFYGLGIGPDLAATVPAATPPINSKNFLLAASNTNLPPPRGTRPPSAYVGSQSMPAMPPPALFSFTNISINSSTSSVQVPSLTLKP